MVYQNARIYLQYPLYKRHSYTSVSSTASLWPSRESPSAARLLWRQPSSHGCFASSPYTTHGGPSGFYRTFEQLFRKVHLAWVRLGLVGFSGVQKIGGLDLPVLELPFGLLQVCFQLTSKFGHAFFVNLLQGQCD